MIDVFFSLSSRFEAARYDHTHSYITTDITHTLTYRLTYVLRDSSTVSSPSKLWLETAGGRSDMAQEPSPQSKSNRGIRTGARSNQVSGGTSGGHAQECVWSWLGGGSASGSFGGQESTLARS